MAPMIKPVGKIVSIAKPNGSMNLGRLSLQRTAIMREFSPTRLLGSATYRRADKRAEKLHHALSIAPPYLTDSTSMVNPT